MAFLYYKALHIIFVVTWFAGLFYIVRLFIYHAEAASKQEPERSILINQYKIMERRLWFGITWPSMILTLTFGLLMIYEVPSYLKLPFMHVKLGLVTLLVVYHLSCHAIYSKLRKDNYILSSFKLRIWNEVATLFLISIVFVIIIKNNISILWGISGLILIALLLYASIKIYKKLRND